MIFVYFQNLSNILEKTKFNSTDKAITVVNGVFWNQKSEFVWKDDNIGRIDVDNGEK